MTHAVLHECNEVLKLDGYIREKCPTQDYNPGLDSQTSQCEQQSKLKCYLHFKQKHKILTNLIGDSEDNKN